MTSTIKFEEEQILKILVIIHFEKCYHNVCFPQHWRWEYTKQFCQLFCMGMPRAVLLWRTNMYYKQN